MLAGGMAEWSMAVVLKTTKVQAFGGSNPSPSARALLTLVLSVLAKQQCSGTQDRSASDARHD